MEYPSSPMMEDVDRNKQKTSVPPQENPDSHDDAHPKGVNRCMWEKFQKLQKRRLEISERSSAKRIKKLQKEVIERVADDFAKTDDIDVLRSHQVELPGDRQSLKNAATKENNEDTPNLANTSTTAPDGKQAISSSKSWMDFTPYLNINAHLKGTDRGKCAPKTELEKKIDSAIDQGDYGTAEELSDHLSTRDLGKKIADAFDAKQYSEKKKKADEDLKARHKKKLPWGFSHKQRWETKSNM